VDKLTQEVVPIAILCVAIALVVSRLPKVDVGHSAAFRRRRVLNWLPLGLTYAFLYMGRYNIVALMNPHLCGHHVITQAAYGDVDAVGGMVYALSFLINGPLCDRWGGRRAILIAASGALVANVAIGFLIASSSGAPAIGPLMVLYAVNMYFQSFGAASIVKVNAAWFHLRERGTFGGIFGILISLGLYFAFDWAPKIASLSSIQWLFFAPALVLALFLLLDFLFVRDNPSGAGYADFDVADASSSEPDVPESGLHVIKRLITNPIIFTIACIEFCSGFISRGILKWFRAFAAGVGAAGSYFYDHWGMISCVAGIVGGMFAGTISDYLFQSRRPPVAAVLYGITLGGAIAVWLLLAVPPALSPVVAIMLMAMIGVHGMLSGVASQDFGGKRHAGVAAALIDGFVYLGTSLQTFLYGHLMPAAGSPAAKDAHNWWVWPAGLIPITVLGLALGVRVWNARVSPKSNSH
jgi:OPA family glycerol-3-phosphate transporter-like MFS transporter